MAVMLYGLEGNRRSGVVYSPTDSMLNWFVKIFRLPVPSTFWAGVPYHIFQDEKMKNLLSTAVNKGDLRRLNYNKTAFRRGRTPMGNLTTLPRPHSRMERG